MAQPWGGLSLEKTSTSPHPQVLGRPKSSPWPLKCRVSGWTQTTWHWFSIVFNWFQIDWKIFRLEIDRCPIWWPHEVPLQGCSRGWLPRDPRTRCAALYSLSLFEVKLTWSSLWSKVDIVRSCACCIRTSVVPWQNLRKPPATRQLRRVFLWDFRRPWSACRKRLRASRRTGNSCGNSQIPLLLPFFLCLLSLLSSSFLHAVKLLWSCFEFRKEICLNHFVAGDRRWPRPFLRCTPGHAADARASTLTRTASKAATGADGHFDSTSGPGARL